MKLCNKCGIIKELSQFNKCKANPDGLQFSCKQCAANYRRAHKMDYEIYRKQYRKLYREKILTQQSEYYQLHREEILKRQSAYNLEHRDKINAYNMEWNLKNPQRAKRLTIKKFVSFIIRPYILIRDSYKCQLCRIGGKNLVAHHIVPIKQDDSEDSLTNPSNLVTLCKKCHLIAHAGLYRKIDLDIAIKLTNIVNNKELANPTQVPKYIK